VRERGCARQLLRPMNDLRRYPSLLQRPLGKAVEVRRENDTDSAPGN
jgi:hypothetical protein